VYATLPAPLGASDDVEFLLPSNDTTVGTQLVGMQLGLNGGQYKRAVA
jgi:hypothetical protein